MLAFAAATAMTATATLAWSADWISPRIAGGNLAVAVAGGRLMVAWSTSALDLRDVFRRSTSWPQLGPSFPFRWGFARTTVKDMYGCFIPFGTCALVFAPLAAAGFALIDD